MNRRTFNKKLSQTIGGVALVSHIPLACAFETSASKKSLGIALVGLGTYSTYELAPSLQETKHCHLAAIVTGTPAKEKRWAEKYAIPQKNIYNYDNFDTIVDNPDVDIGRKTRDLRKTYGS